MCHCLIGHSLVSDNRPTPREGHLVGDDISWVMQLKCEPDTYALVE